jgi:hypothetical protein
MSNTAQIKRGVELMTGVMTAWMESDGPLTDTELAERELAVIQTEGEGGSLIVGFLVTVRELAERLGTHEGITGQQILADLAIKMALLPNDGD